MKNVIVCNIINPSLREFYENYIKAQIENSFFSGWSESDIILVANFAYSYMGVNSVNMNLDCDYCLTGSKSFAVLKLLESGVLNEIAWLHDLDVWQLRKFDFPEISDIGMARYISRWNGGSVFLKPGSKDIFNAIVGNIVDNHYNREEISIKQVLKDSKFSERVTTVDYRFNLGATGFEKRYKKSIKPIFAIHMHPHRGMDIKRNASGMNRLGARTVTLPLFKLFHKYFNIPYSRYNEAEVKVTINTNKYDIRSLKVGEKLHTNRKYSFDYIPDVLLNRKFLVLPHKKKISINIEVIKPGIMEIGFCKEHSDIYDKFSYRYLYSMSMNSIVTDYRHAKTINIYRGSFEKGEKLSFKHGWRVNPIIIARDIYVEG